MDYYFLDKNARKDGCHGVHCGGCGKCPVEKDRIYVGFFSNYRAAVEKAENFFARVKGCPDCSPECLFG